MVKNIGGNKSKKQGRKFVSQPFTKKTKLPEEGEMFAIVTRILGGQNCEIKGIDGKTRLCVIRNKFRGRSKHDNIIKVNGWVLVGVREWEVRKGCECKCDLISVYDDRDKEFLKEQKIESLEKLYKEFDENEKKEDDFIDFVSGNNDKIIEDMEEVVHSDEDEIDFDDI